MPSEAEPPDPMVGRRIGPYRLTKRLGEGGMGVVYLGEREGEFRQRVAIKLVRYGAATQEVMARLRAERQTLAAIQHPNIVALIDGGATEEGLPYFAMEYVEGTPIDEYCAARGLDVEARLRIFLEVCAAVEHAHRNLVVHCDLKPGNILVTAEGTPKLLDFGIAKLLRPEPGAAAGLTVAGKRPFTPRFASPEQVLGKPVTTSTDVYALGMTLFHVLTGRSPYRFQTHSDAELISAVCLQEPQRPSASVEDVTAARSLEGDLDAILLKALRKEPENRYSSVEALADDIRRRLEGQPVTAHQGTWRYRAGKLIRRNRALTAAAAVTLIAVAGGVAGVAWQAHVALNARARAERRFQEVRELARFMLFDFHDEVQKLPGATPVQEMLVKRSLGYLDSLAKEAAGDAEIETELVEAYVRLGDVQGNPYNPNLGDAEGALASYGKALAIAGRLAQSAPDDLRAVRAAASVHAHTADVLLLRRDVKEAAAHGRAAAAAFEKLAAAQPADVGARVDLAASLDGLGDQLGKGLGDAKGAETSYRKSLAAWESVLALDPKHIRAQRALATMNMKLADLEALSDQRAALARLDRALRALAALPENERASVPSRRLEASVLRRVADCQWELNDTAASLATYRQATEAFRALAAADPANARAQFDLVVALNNGGEALETAGDVAGALHNYAQVADALDALLKNDPENVGWRANRAEILVRIGGLLGKTGQPGEARRQTARGLAAARALADAADTPPSELARAARLLVLCEPQDLRDPGAAARYARRAAELTKFQDAYALDALAEAQLQSGDRAGAEQTVRQALALSGAAQAPPAIKRALEGKLERLK